MKKQLEKTYTYFIAAVLITAGATSCKKEVSGSNPAATNTTVATTATSTTIAVAADAATGTTGSTTPDSVYIINPCDKGTHRDSIAATALPATIQTYLAANYSGYTFNKAFAVKDTTGAVKGFVVIINFNNKPVGLQFTSDGTFVKVLEQREKGDLNGNGWHQGGRFDCRDGQHRDSVALAALSSAITAYLHTSYASDTLLHAFKLDDGGYVVLSKNGGLFATIFTSAGVFVNRISLPAPGSVLSAANATLPSAALSYLNTTYPNYVLEKAFSVSVNGTVKGYIAVINANNTRYCVAFDASGGFLAVKTIW